MKTFYVVSALRHDSGQLGSLKRYDTEKEAVEGAKWVIEQRIKDGKGAMDFYVLKVVAEIAIAAPPIKVKKLK